MAYTASSIQTANDSYNTLGPEPTSLLSEVDSEVENAAPFLHHRWRSERLRIQEDQRSKALNMEEKHISGPPAVCCSLCGAREDGRRLVVALDGTMNRFGTRIYARVVKSDNQVTYYNSGMGTYAHTVSKSITKSLKQTLRSGVESLIAWLFPRCIPSQSIGRHDRYLSRWQLVQIGLISPGNEEQIPFAFELYAKAAEDRKLMKQVASWSGQISKKERLETKLQSLKANQDRANVFKKTFSCHDAKVHFLGAWDTVSSVGIFRSKKDLPKTQSADHICYFRHALALDERRVRFAPEDVYREADTRAIYEQALGNEDYNDLRSQMTSGGGVKPNMDLLLDAKAAVWMANEAQAKGLKMCPPDGGWDPTRFQGGKPNESLKGFWWLLEWVPGLSRVEDFPKPGRSGKQALWQAGIEAHLHEHITNTTKRRDIHQERRTFLHLYNDSRSVPYREFKNSVLNIILDALRVEDTVPLAISALLTLVVNQVYFNFEPPYYQKETILRLISTLLKIFERHSDDAITATMLQLPRNYPTWPRSGTSYFRQESHLQILSITSERLQDDGDLSLRAAVPKDDFDPYFLAWLYHTSQLMLNKTCKPILQLLVQLSRGEDRSLEASARDDFYQLSHAHFHSETNRISTDAMHVALRVHRIQEIYTGVLAFPGLTAKLIRTLRKGNHTSHYFVSNFPNYWTPDLQSTKLWGHVIDVILEQSKCASSTNPSEAAMRTLIRLACKHDSLRARVLKNGLVDDLNDWLREPHCERILDILADTTVICDDQLRHALCNGGVLRTAVKSTASMNTQGLLVKYLTELSCYDDKQLRTMRETISRIFVTVLASHLDDVNVASGSEGTSTPDVESEVSAQAMDECGHLDSPSLLVPDSDDESGVSSQVTDGPMSLYSLSYLSPHSDHESGVHESGVSSQVMDGPMPSNSSSPTPITNAIIPPRPLDYLPAFDTFMPPMHLDSYLPAPNTFMPPEQFITPNDVRRPQPRDIMTYTYYKELHVTPLERVKKALVATNLRQT
ncbi:predicted protein [Postia placenta Mad-698-R]|nr:predicted protein [Postia placenta Mad-698-R]